MQAVYPLILAQDKTQNYDSYFDLYVCACGDFHYKKKEKP
jgi:hypothetical protein